jgi:hypothetical protein
MEPDGTRQATNRTVATALCQGILEWSEPAQLFLGLFDSVGLSEWLRISDRERTACTARNPGSSQATVN